ncbi:MAG: hypothetical protein IT371_26075 [Deltaproteobacteria bacterium]|nr:hypothetical protein [Deltaproteobacteria bacterium]
MSHHEPEHGAPGAHPPVEPDAIPLAPIWIWMFALVVLISGGILIARTFFYTSTKELLQERQLGVTPTEIRALKAGAEAELASYGEVNKAEGRYRIPIDRAMDLLAREPARLAPAAPPAPPAPAPAAAPAPADAAKAAPATPAKQAEPVKPADPAKPAAPKTP